MDCNAVAERVAPYLDNELSKSEQQLFEQHLEVCEACQELVERVASVDLSPPPPREEVGAPGFWDAMDEAIAAEQAREPAPTASRPSAGRRLWSWELRVSLPVVLAYAAFLLLAIGWSFANLERARDAEDALIDMTEMVQREQRRNQQPATTAVPASEVRVASSTRGTF